MAHLDELILDIVSGEDRELPRTIDMTPIDPDTLSKAWLTVKANEDDADVDAIFQKIITTALSADGQIDDSGSADLSAHLYFLIPSADTDLLTPGQYYFYDIKGLSSSGAKKVLEGGRMIANHPITLAQA